MGAIKSEAQSRQRRLGITLDLGIYWGWMSLVFFSTALAGIGGIASVELANFVALTVSTVVVGILAFLSPALGAEDGRKSSAASDDNLGRIDWHVAGALGVERRCVAYYRSLLGRPARRISSLSFRQPSYSSVSLGGGRRRAVLVGPPHSAALYLTVAFLGTAAGYIALRYRCCRSRASRRMLIRGPRRTPRDRMLKRPERGFLFGVPAKSSPGSCCWASPSSASPSA